MSSLKTTNILHPSSTTNNIVLASNGSTTVGNLVATQIQGGAITLATAQNSTSGTAINFPDIPSWVKRITVMFNGVSTNGSSGILIQIGSGSITSSGYVSTAVGTDTGSLGHGSSTAGFLVITQTGSDTKSGVVQLVTLGSNAWVSTAVMKLSTTQTSYGGGNVTLSGTLDRLRITTINGTDTFDAGTINIMYEG